MNNTICDKCTGETVEDGKCRNCGHVEEKTVVVLNEDGSEKAFEAVPAESVTEAIPEPTAEVEETLAA